MTRPNSKHVTGYAMLAASCLGLLFEPCACSDQPSASPDVPPASSHAGDAAVSAPGFTDGGDPLLAMTAYGPVRGVNAGSSRVFRGVRYAAAPVGPLRFARAQPPQPWTEPPPALPTVCPQFGADGGVFGNEDCLTLDVWVPLQSPAKPLPVMVWIHGGGFTAGSGFLNDAALPSRGVIVVAINYRLAALGFLAHPALGADSGNAAIDDQRFALQWVRDNVAAFGGDPQRVTIFGESAGGSAICAQLWSPLSAGLFSRAIMQSGALCGRQSRTLAEGEAQGERLATALGCDAAGDVLACLRDQPLGALLSALPVRTLLVDGASWGPVVDGTVFTHDLPAALAQGAFNHVPMLVGSNAHEGLAFTAGLESLTAEQYEAQVRDSPFFGAHADELLAAYPAADYDSPQLALAALVGERVFNCPARRTVRALEAAGSDSYLYLFDYPPALHAGELGYLFGSGLAGDDQRVAGELQDLWTSFATGGEPSGDGLPTWPRYSAAQDQHLVIGAAPAIDAHLFARTCDVWDAFEG